MCDRSELCGKILGNSLRSSPSHIAMERMVASDRSEQVALGFIPVLSHFISIPDFTFIAKDREFEAL